MKPNVSIRPVAGGKIAVASPYNADFLSCFRASNFTKDARRLGGKWSGSEWVFDARDEAAVRAACIDNYGTDGETEAPTVTALVRASLYVNGSRVEWGGRTLATRWGRDEAVRLGDGVSIVEGAFADWGGSVKNPRIGDASGVVLRVRDVPAHWLDGADWDENGLRAEGEIPLPSGPSLSPACLTALAALRALTPDEAAEVLLAFSETPSGAETLALVVSK